MLVELGKADSLLSWFSWTLWIAFERLRKVMKVKMVKSTTVNGLILPIGNLFIADTFVNPNPTTEELAKIVLMSAQEIQHFGIKPQVALVSHSNYGSFEDESAVKMKGVLPLVRQADSDLIIDGEMRCNIALSESLRNSNAR